MIRFTCSACGKSITAPDQHAGKRAKCPGCKAIVQIPAAAKPDDEGFEVVDEGFEEVKEPPAPKKPAKTTAVRAKRPTDDEDVPEVEAADDDDRPRKPRRPVPDLDDDEEEEERPRKKKRRRGVSQRGRTGYYTCPSCGADAASKVGFTWWGGIIGPAILSHVSCDNCGTAYNGKTGKSNTTGIIIYIVVTSLIGIAIVGAVFAATVLL